MIRVLISDHRRLRREGLRELINRDDGMTAVAEATSPSDAAETAMQARPDVVLMSVDLPGTEWFEATKRIQQSLPKTRVVAISSDKQTERVAQALEVSAWGYAVDEDGFDQLREAIQQVHSGRYHYTPSALEHIVPRGGELRMGKPLQTRLGTLTRRERELLTLLARGYSLKKACKVLEVSYKTADKHKVNLMKKLDIHDRVELARFAIREKLVEA